MVTFIKTNFPAQIEPQTIPLQCPLRDDTEVAIDNPLPAEKIRGTVAVGSVTDGIEIIIVKRFAELLSLIVSAPLNQVDSVVEGGTLAQLEAGIEGIDLLEEIICESLVGLPAELPIVDVIPVNTIPHQVGILVAQQTPELMRRLTTAVLCCE